MSGALIAALWFLSLIPAVMLRTTEAIERPEQDFAKAATRGVRRWSVRALASGIHHPRRIAFFVLTTGFISLGYGAIGPLFSVAFHEGHLQAEDVQIGFMFAGGELGLAAAMLFVPLLAARMLKVDAIALTRMLALPFVFGMGLLPLLLGEGGLLVWLVGASYAGRVMVFRMSGPLDDAFNMEVLDARERATSTGIEIAVGGAVTAVAIFAGSRLLDGGDYTTPFLIVGACYAISTAIYWRAFRPLELSELSKQRAEDVPSAVAGGGS